MAWAAWWPGIIVSNQLTMWRDFFPKPLFAARTPTPYLLCLSSAAAFSVLPISHLLCNYLGYGFHPWANKCIHANDIIVLNMSAAFDVLWGMAGVE